MMLGRGRPRAASRRLRLRMSELWTMQAMEAVYLDRECQFCFALRDEPAGFRLVAESFRWEMDLNLLDAEDDIGFR